MIPIQVNGGRRGSPPLQGAFFALLVTGGAGDQADELGCAGRQEDPRIGVTLEDGQVRLAEVTGQRGHRHQLPDQVLDPHLVLAGRAGQPVTGTNPPVQRRRVRAGQLQLLQTTRVSQRNPGQRLRVDPVRFGVPAQEPAQVRGLGRGHPVHVVTAAGEEHRDRHPRRPGRLEHHRQPRTLRRAGQCGLLH